MSRSLRSSQRQKSSSRTNINVIPSRKQVKQKSPTENAAARYLVEFSLLKARVEYSVLANGHLEAVQKAAVHHGKVGQVFGPAYFFVTGRCQDLFCDCGNERTTYGSVLLTPESAEVPA